MCFNSKFFKSARAALKAILVLRYASHFNLVPWEVVERRDALSLR